MSLTAFLEHLPSLSSVDAGRVLELAQATWPQVELDAGGFGAFLAARVQDELRAAHVTDLYLCWAVLAGQPLAISAFEQLLSTWASSALQRAPPGVDRDEVLSALRLKLMVARPEAPAALGAYTGRGPLKAWVAIATLRALSDAIRRSPEPAPAEAMELAVNLVDDSRSVDSQLGTAQFRPHLREALEASLRELPLRLRTVMRLHFVDGVPAEVLAKMYGVHRATTSRWILEARRRVLERTWEQLADVVGPETFSSIRRELEHFELSLPDLFATLPD